MTTIYEGMFLIDNAVVREDWSAAKLIVTGTLEKHGATILTARRWDERRLAYPIKKRNRATFLLTYFEIPGENIPAMRREFELTDSILRSLEVAVDAVPEEERELAAAEQGAEFSVPTPPEDDALDPEPERQDDDEDGERSYRGKPKAVPDEPKADGDKAKAEGDKPKPEGDEATKTEATKDEPATATSEEGATATTKEGATTSEEN